MRNLAMLLFRGATAALALLAILSICGCASIQPPGQPPGRGGPPCRSQDRDSRHTVICVGSDLSATPDTEHTPGRNELHWYATEPGPKTFTIRFETDKDHPEYFEDRGCNAVNGHSHCSKVPTAKAPRKVALRYSIVSSGASPHDPVIIIDDTLTVADP
jgi:hypothetical protein